MSNSAEPGRRWWRLNGIRTEPGQQPTSVTRQLAALLAFTAILMPWFNISILEIDGSMNGAETLIHSILSPHKHAWLEQDILGTQLFFLHTPVLMIIVTLVFLRTMKEQRSTWLNIAAVLLPILTTAAAADPIFNQPSPTYLGLAIPGAGLLTIIMVNAAMALHDALNTIFANEQPPPGS